MAGADDPTSWLNCLEHMSRYLRNHYCNVAVRDCTSERLANVVEGKLEGSGYWNDAVAYYQTLMGSTGRALQSSVG